MKKRILKSIFAALLVASMAFSMTACGGDANGDAATGGDANTSADAGAAKALTEDEYMAKFDELGKSMTDLQTEASQLDPSDPAAAKALLEKLKTPFSDFAALTPPDKYAEAHAKFKSGCEAMISYIDTSIQMMEETDAAKQADLLKKAQEYMTTAMQDMTEGATLADSAS